MYRQYIESANLSLEKDTNIVPKDNKYHVIKDDTIIYSSVSLKAAQTKFNDLKPEVKNELTKNADKTEILTKEKEVLDMGDKKPKKGPKKKNPAEKAPVEKPIVDPERKKKPRKKPKK